MKTELHKNVVLSILAFAQLMDVLDTTVVTIALPTISKDLNIIGVNNLQWLITIYGLTYAGFLFLAGRLADIFGRRKIFMLGVFLFGVGSLLAGLSPTSISLIICRAIQGLGASFIASAALSLLILTFEEGQARNKAMLVWGAVIAGGAAWGLLLGGIITQYVSWRWIFFVNVPISILVMISTPAFIPKFEGYGLQSIWKFDLLGTFLLTSGLISLVFGLSKAPTSGIQDTQVFVFIVASIALLTAFTINELRVRDPLLNLRLFGNRNVGVASFIMIFVVGCNSAMLFFLSIYNQQVLGYAPFEAGLAALPVIILAVLALQIVRKLLDKFGFKPVIIGQMLILFAGLLLLSLLPVNGHYIRNELPSLLIMAFGIPASISITLAATSGTQKEESGAISGVINTAQQIGGPLVLAVLSTVAATYSRRAVDTNAKLTSSIQGIHAAFIAGAVLMLFATLICITTLKQTGKV